MRDRRAMRRAGARQESSRGGPARRGMVLLIVLIVVTMLSLAGYSFAQWMFAEHQSTRVFGEALQIEYVMESGEQFAQWLAEQPWKVQQDAGGASDNPDLVRGVVVLDDEHSGRRGRFSLVMPRREEGQVTGARFGLESESARLNLTVLLEWDRKKPGSARQALMRLPGMTVETADALLDWLDADSEPREYGAEDEYYASLDPPYAARNGMPATLEELLLVKGITRERLFGPDASMAAEDDRRATAAPARSTTLPAAASEPIGEAAPWAWWLTLYSAERNVTAEGQPRIGLNGGDLSELHRRLLETLGRQWADFVVAYRQFGPYAGPERPARDAPVAVDTTLPARFQVTTILDLVGTRVFVPSNKDDSFTVLASPLAVEQIGTSDTLERLFDRTTVDQESVIVGRINLNTAPAAVLRTIPEIDDAAAQRILAARSSLAGEALPAKRLCPAWPLIEGLVDLDTMKRLLPYVTTRADVYRTQVVGFFDTTGPSRRVEIVVDAAHRPVREVYRKDLSLLGIGYDRQLLGAGARERTEGT